MGKLVPRKGSENFVSDFKYDEVASYQPHCKPTKDPVIFDDTTIKPRLLDEKTGKTREIPTSWRKGVNNVMKTPCGRWKPSVRAAAKEMYFCSYTPREIAIAFTIPEQTVKNWALGVKGDKKDPKCWYLEREQLYENVMANNVDMLSHIHRDYLRKLRAHAHNLSHIESVDEAKKVADILKTLIDPSHKGSAGTVVNVQTLVQPMSTEEAIKIIQNDPVRKKLTK